MSVDSGDLNVTIYISGYKCPAYDMSWCLQYLKLEH